MNGTTETTVGLGHGRDWSELPADDAVVAWDVSADQGLVQGPLDLGFLRGRRVALRLAPGQVALLVCDGMLQAVYLDGGHVLDVGTGRGQVPSRGHLVFLTVGEGLDVRWTAQQPLCVGDGGPGIIGRCTLEVTGPGRFYDTFLAGDASWDEAFIRRLVQQAVRAAVERLVDGWDDDPMGLQTRLTGLAPADLDEELAPLGLACRRAALYTAAPPVEDGSVASTGQFPVVGHN